MGFCEGAPVIGGLGIVGVGIDIGLASGAGVGTVVGAIGVAVISTIWRRTNFAFALSSSTESFSIKL